MRKVKSIVLFISLFFIATISIIIMQNLEDSEEFIDVVQTSTNLTQTNIIVHNIKDEVLLFFKKNAENLDTIFDIIPEQIPLSFKGINLVIEPKYIDFDNKYYIYEKKEKLVAALYEDDIHYPDDLIKLRNENNITNFRQLDFIIDKYIEITKDTNILKIKDKFTIVKNEDGLKNENNETKEIDYISCNYDVNVNGLKSHVDMIINIENKKSKIEYFDFYFKGNNE